MRSGPDPLTLTDAVREAIWAVDPDQPVWEIMFIGDRIARTVQGRRFFMVLLAVFAVMALAMGSVGIYGVVSYGVRRRTLEIGVRMAFGARNREIQTMVLKQGLFMILLGVVLGLVGAASLSRVLSASLFAVSPYDPATFAAVPIVLVLVATVACYLPARRATGVDPARTLHEG